MRDCVQANAEKGIPVMRPLFFDCPKDGRAYARENYSYCLGDELLVAPVVRPGEKEREAYLPAAGWIHLWSGVPFPAGTVRVEAPMGCPPVFYRSGCAHEDLFRKISRDFG